MAEPERISQAEAETRADADTVIADLYLRRLTTAAIADAHRAKLMQLREQNATGRTYASTEREVDKIHSQGLVAP